MIIFWIVWLVAALALVVVFLCKVPVLLINKIISSAAGKRDYAVLTANLQDGVSVLCEPSSQSGRYLSRYQIYRRNSDRKFFIGEWKYPVETAEYGIYCYNSDGALLDIIRVSESVGKKRYTSVCELPQTTDYVVLRVKRADGKRLRAKPADGAAYLWLALLFLCCAAAVCAALCAVYAFLTRVLPEAFNSGWNGVALSSAVVCVVCALTYALLAIWLLVGGKSKPQRQVKKAKPLKKRGTYIKIWYFFFVAACKIRNALQGVLWAFPLRKFTLRGRESVPNARAVKRLKKDEGKQ